MLVFSRDTAKGDKLGLLFLKVTGFLVALVVFIPVPAAVAFSPVTHSAGGMVTHESFSGAPSPLSPYRHVPGKILVRFRKSASAASRARIHSKMGTKVIRKYRIVKGLQLVKLPHGMSVEHAIRKFGKMSEVLYAEPDYVVNAFLTPNDPSFTEQWALSNTGQTGGLADADIDAPEAWELTTGSSDIVIATLDTGIDYTHPDLASNIFSNSADCNSDGVDDDGDGYIDDCHGINVLTGSGDPMDDHGHGTHVAGIIGAVGNNGVGIAGVNWTTRILGCKFLDSTGTGDTAGAIACLDYIAGMKDRGVNIVATNNSWGGGAYSQAMSDAIEAQLERGILFVVAAGNDGMDNDTLQTYPCSYPLSNVICVASTDSSDNMSSFSNYGKRIVDLGAPGEGILSTFLNDTYQSLDGTSMATPHVTGVVGLIYALYPDLDWRAAKNRILAGGDIIPALDQTVTNRRLNAYGALSCTDSVVSARLRPLSSTLSVGPGSPIELSALNIDCGNPNGNVVVNVSPGGETVTLLDDGLDSDQVAGDGIYTATWTPQTAGTYTLTFPGNDTVSVNVDGDMETGFPVKAWQDAGNYHGGQAIHTLVADIDGNPGLEIVATGLADGPLNAWSSDGNVVNGWPLDTGAAAYPAAGELSFLDPGSEVFFAAYADEPDLFAYDGSGIMLPGWPLKSANYVATPPSLADVNGDGLDEIFLEEEDWEFHAYKADGSVLEGWPVSENVGGQERHTAAIADIDGDGDPEIITVSGVSSGVELFAYHKNGLPVTGFPVSFNGYVDTFPVIGDVDGDGEEEIVVVGKYFSGTSWLSEVLIYSSGGVLKREIPLSGGASYGTAPALADLDGDGTPEIIVQTNASLEVVRGSDGSYYPGWPVVWGSGYWLGNSSPVVGDVDGDGLPDIVVTTEPAGSTTDGVVRVYDRNGISIGDFPKTLPIGDGAVPAIADIDGDGRNEIIVTGDYWDGYPGYYDKVWAYDLGGSSYGPVLWGQFMGNAEHTGFYTGPRKDQTITFADLPAKTFGYPSFTLSATSDSGLQVSYASSDPGVATINGNTLTITGAGTSTITAFQSGNSDYNAAPCVNRVLTVNKADADVEILSDSPDPSVRMEPVTVIYSVTSSAGTPTGSVTVSDGVTSCTGTVSAGSCSLPLSTTGDRTLTAQYGGDGNFNTSVSAGEPHTVSTDGYALVVGKAGTGGGTVSTDTGTLVWTLNTGTASYDYGTVVTLTAIGDDNSVLSGWSGCDSVNNSACTVTMTGQKNVTASFTLKSQLPVRIAGSASGYYSTIQSAYKNATDGDAIECQTHVFDEALDFDQDISIVIDGGYDESYSTNSGMSTITELTVSSGAVTVDNIVIH